MSDFRRFAEALLLVRDSWVIFDLPMTEALITQDQLKTLLLKCVGSKYPVRIRLKDSQVKFVFVKGFSDPDCCVINVSKTPSGAVEPLDVKEVKSLRSMKPLTLERLRGFQFDVN